MGGQRQMGRCSGPLPGPTPPTFGPGQQGGDHRLIEGKQMLDALAVRGETGGAVEAVKRGVGGAQVGGRLKQRPVSSFESPRPRILRFARGMVLGDEVRYIYCPDQRPLDLRRERLFLRGLFVEDGVLQA